MRKIICILMVIMLLTLGIGTVHAEGDYPLTYRVTASVLNVRFGPGMNYDVFYKLIRDEEVPGKESNGDWTEIDCYGFKGFVWTGYIKDKNKEPEPQQTTSIGTPGTYLGNYYVTGYSPYCAHCCGKSNGITASGTKAVVGQTIAMAGIAFGTKVYIEGLGTYIVQDRGVGKGVIDVACNSHADCYKITGRYNVYLQ